MHQVLISIRKGRSTRKLARCSVYDRPIDRFRFRFCFRNGPLKLGPAGFTLSISLSLSLVMLATASGRIIGLRGLHDVENGFRVAAAV